MEKHNEVKCRELSVAPKATAHSALQEPAHPAIG